MSLIRYRFSEEINIVPKRNKDKKFEVKTLYITPTQWSPTGKQYATFNKEEAKKWRDMEYDEMEQEYFRRNGEEADPYEIYEYLESLIKTEVIVDKKFIYIDEDDLQASPYIGKYQIMGEDKELIKMSFENEEEMEKVTNEYEDKLN